MCRPTFSSASASGSTSENLPMPDLAAILAKALPPLPQPMMARCLCDNRSASFGLRANTGSIILNSFQSRLVDHGSIGIYNEQSHAITFQALASEVEGVDVYSRILALHHPGDELVGVQGVVIAGQNFPDRAPVAARKPRHASRVNMEFSDPANPRHGASERLVNGIRDRKSTRLNSSHGYISYAVFCLKKKKKKKK